MLGIHLKTKSSDISFNNFAEFFIGSEVSAAGNCSTDQDVFIDGKFNGVIKTSGLVELSKNSKVSANIEARTAIVEGNYKGDIITKDEINIASCATIKGNITSRDIVVDKGAIINAKIKMEQEN